MDGRASRWRTSAACGRATRDVFLSDWDAAGGRELRSAQNSGAAERSPRMRVELVIDRLRDLVRRSILARLMFNDDGVAVG